MGLSIIKICFLGCDSTHTEAFANRINAPEGAFYGKAKVISIYGESNEQAIEKAGRLNIPLVTTSIEEALESADVAMVIGRFGESHFIPAKTALAKGIPVFVDKPFTISAEEARELINLSKETNTRMFSSSPLRFSKEVNECKEIAKKAGDDLIMIRVTVPANCTDLGPDPRLDSAFFYGIHGIESLLEITGHAISDIQINYHKSYVSCDMELENKTHASFQLIRDAPEFYCVELYTKTEYFHFNINLDGSYYETLVGFLLNEFFTGKDTIALESTYQSISILDSIETKDPFKS
jgi:predicted dehydrogenase